MIEFDHKTKKASPEWLTSVLTRNGFLTTGEVIGVDQKPSLIGFALTSEFFDLTLQYGARSTGAKPANFLMKVGKPERFHITRREAAFYELARLSDRPNSLLASFGTAVDEVAQSAVILLQDLREESVTTEWPIPPTFNTCERAVTSLARIHAMWWNSPVLTRDAFERITPDRFVSVGILAAFLDALGDGISPPRRAILEQLLERFPRVLARRVSQTNFQTLIHGDAHLWNVLFPTDDSRPPVWIDWQAWGVGFGALDLAYMIGLHWFPERRNRFENALLSAYHLELEQRGIDYSYDDLTYDYRLQVAGQLFMPVIQWSMKIPAAVWWPHLDRAFSAFEDLDCRELLFS